MLTKDQIVIFDNNLACCNQKEEGKGIEYETKKLDGNCPVLCKRVPGENDTVCNECHYKRSRKYYAIPRSVPDYFIVF